MYSERPRSERSLPLAPPSEAPESERPRRGSGVLRFLRDVLIILVAAVVISFLIKTFLIRSFYIPSSSMEETLHIQDRIIVNQLEPTGSSALPAIRTLPPADHRAPLRWNGWGYEDSEFQLTPSGQVGVLCPVWSVLCVCVSLADGVLLRLVFGR